jgi:signal transduction histidine kinase/ActR/RegA family two-component response regulator
MRTQFRYPADSKAPLAWWSSKVHPDDRARVDRSFKAALEGHASSWFDEYRFIRGDGTVAYVRDRGFIIRDASGRAVRAIGAMHDITERRELERRLAISDRMASLGTLAAGVAHEINNPLFYVLGNIDLAIQTQESVGTDPEVLDALREARQGAVRIAEIVRSMRIFGRSEPATSNDVDVDKVVTSALSMAMNEIRHRARLVKELGSPPPAAANEPRLVQVVLNLLVNAAQSIREGSADRDEIAVATGLSADGMIYIEVRDTGGGMAPETLAHVFDPFFTTKGAGHGMGLGLSIAHSIVSSFGGEIRVSSTQGKGSTFRVLLPRAVATTARIDAPAPRARSGRRKRILVVEDEPAVVRALRRLLDEEHHVVVADGGTTALSLLRADAGFDAVLCDVMMPDLTGADLHREIRDEHAELARRFVFMSGGAFGAQAREYVESSKQPALVKPFDRTQLLQALAELESAGPDDR